MPRDCDWQEGRRRALPSRDTDGLLFPRRRLASFYYTVLEGGRYARRQHEVAAVSSLPAAHFSLAIGASP